ncbi:hypothetical protein HDV05_007832 [Chytridiales sp. JEL 0842]|nr:hypothetical protein HDV05_007832 [Chytridiales sp. JEL 0842]
MANRKSDGSPKLTVGSIGAIFEAGREAFGVADPNAEPRKLNTAASAPAAEDAKGQSLELLKRDPSKDLSEPVTPSSATEPPVEVLEHNKVRQAQRSSEDATSAKSKPPPVPPKPAQLRTASVSAKKKPSSDFDDDVFVTPVSLPPRGRSKSTTAKATAKSRSASWASSLSSTASSVLPPRTASASSDIAKKLPGGNAEKPTVPPVPESNYIETLENNLKMAADMIQVYQINEEKCRREVQEALAYLKKDCDLRERGSSFICCMEVMGITCKSYGKHNLPLFPTFPTIAPVPDTMDVDEQPFNVTEYLANLQDTLQVLKQEYDSVAIDAVKNVVVKSFTDDYEEYLESVYRLKQSGDAAQQAEAEQMESNLDGILTQRLLAHISPLDGPS